MPCFVEDLAWKLDGIYFFFLFELKYSVYLFNFRTAVLNVFSLRKQLDNTPRLLSVAHKKAFLAVSYQIPGGQIC